MQRLPTSVTYRKSALKLIGNIALAVSGLAVTALALLALETKFSSFNVIEHCFRKQLDKQSPKIRPLSLVYVILLI